MDVEAADLAELIDGLRRIGGEPDSVEAKSGAGGFPKSVRETLVAFANTDGGTILIGVDEEQDFAVVDLPEPARYRDDLVALARDAITPPLSITTRIVALDGRHVLVAHVPRLPDVDRPAYVTSKGLTTGSYLRAGDGDRRMSEGEIGLVYGSRTQPRYDLEPVPGTSTEDLDWRSLRRTLQRVLDGSPKLRDADETRVLHRLGVLAEPTSDSSLTLAGYLTFGDYPQHLFPQLMVSVVVYPQAESIAATEGRVRFLDNVTVRGSIPELVSEATAVLRRNLAARAVMSDLGRTDVLEYPVEPIREAIVNALLHRDYSPLTRGTQVQVSLYPDRLVIRSPGGLYGGLITDDLGEDGPSTSRNAMLASLLSDTYLPHSEQLVAENRSTGIPTMIRLARTRGLPRPLFTSTVLSFVVAMGRSELLGPDVRRWIATTAGVLPTSTHQVALAMLRNGPVTNAVLREWGADRIQAGQVLRDLVARGLAVKEGGRRYARYVLDPRLTSPTEPRTAFREPSSGVSTSPERPATPDSASAVRTILENLGTVTAADIQQRTGLSRPSVLTRLKALEEKGLAVAEGSRNSPKRRYRWVGDTSKEQR